MPRSVIRDNPSALSFDGDNDYAVWSYAKTNGGTARTVAFWVKLRSVSSVNNIISFGTGNTAYENIKLMTNGQFRLELNGGGGGMRYTFPTANPLPATSVLNKWTHIAYTRGAFVSADARAAGDITGTYINGVLLNRATASIGASTPSMVNLTLGVVGTTSLADDLNGIVDDVLVYDRELSAAEIAQLALNIPPPSDYDFYAKLDEGSGTAPVALGASGSTGTISGATYTTDTPTKLRTASSNRVAVQDIKSSLSFNGTNTYIQTSVVPNINSFSFATKIYWHPNALVGGRTIFHCQDASGGIYIKHQNPSSRKLGVDTYNIGSTTGLVSPNELSIGWHTIGVTRDTTKTYMYVDGVLVNSVACTMTAAASSVSRIGYSLANVQDWLGNMSGIILSNTATFTAAEMLAYHKSGTIPSGATAVYKLDEGAGTTAYDSSGNGNHGTITNGTFTSDVPTRKRGVVGGNLVYNGDFEYAPPFVAATTTSGRWIDGTAGGSTTNSLFGWYNNGAAADSTLQFSVEDGYKCVKGVKAAGGVLEMRQYGNYYGKNTPILPSTSYTMSARVKITNASGSASTGIILSNYLSAGDGTTAAGSFSTTSGLLVANTDGWVQITRTFTTGATARFANPMIRCVCSDGSGTLAMTFYVRDITLTPTTNTTRTAIS